MNVVLVTLAVVPLLAAVLALLPGRLIAGSLRCVWHHVSGACPRPGACRGRRPVAAGFLRSTRSQ
ncbi:MAG: hypothetical protein LC721_07170 [Actinobacteria bacterium]|nr:hypothetical protein [Actinomycetota bacterium]